jgi:outer membrane protein OmpA-like peptidoglycan-associated protein
MRITKRVTKTLFLLPLLLLLFSGACFGQNVEFTRASFPDDPKGLREARKNLRQGEKLYEQGGGAIYAALDLLMKAYTFNPDNAWLNYRIGHIYLETAEHDHAIPFLEKAAELNVPTVDVHFLLGRAYHLNYRFADAINQYNYYRQSLNPQELAERRNQIDRHIAECRNARELVANPVRVFVDNPGSGLNTPYDDYSPQLSPDGQTMYFTSRRPLGNRPRTDRSDHKYFENIFEAQKMGGTWQVTGPAAGRINSRSHDATAGIAADGSILVVYRGNRGGDLYESVLKDGKWGRPKRLSRGINTRNQETSAAISSDGNTMYFVSDRSGGYGGKDIWVTQRDRRGRWSEPVNLGPTVNTEYDEESVFLAPDDVTLYFSSKGHNSMGGFDIFRTTYRNGRWSEPENLGYPINSPGDDLFFVLAPDGETAYLSSMRPDGHGGSDIYMITFLGPEKPMISQPVDELIASRARPVPEAFLDQEVAPMAPMTLLRGRVLDDETQDPLLATIELYDNEEEELLAQFQTNPETGAYYISLPGGKNYGIAVQAEDYLFHSENINIVEANVFREIINDIRMKRMEVGTTIVLNNIFFDTGQSTLRPESYAELGVLYKLLVDNASLKIEISGHTDNVGSAALNQRLSEDRARAVVNFLVDRGIDRDRLTYKGYGFTRPIASNETAEGRQQNRRTEFEIIDK